MPRKPLYQCATCKRFVNRVVVKLTDEIGICEQCVNEGKDKSIADHCERCGKPIRYSDKVYSAIHGGTWLLFCSDQCREVTCSPSPEYIAMVRSQLAKLYVEVDFKNYDKEKEAGE